MYCVLSVYAYHASTIKTSDLKRGYLAWIVSTCIEFFEESLRAGRVIESFKPMHDIGLSRSHERLSHNPTRQEMGEAKTSSADLPLSSNNSSSPDIPVGF